jgi:hypothetical protein
MNREEIEESLKDEVSNFVDLHDWDNSIETGALYTGFHMVNVSMDHIQSLENRIKELEGELNKFYENKYESDKLFILAGRLKRS